jgi:hypothetical protein
MTTMNRSRMAATALIVLLYAAPARPQAVLPERGMEVGLRENVYGLGLAAGAAFPQAVNATDRSMKTYKSFLIIGSSFGSFVKR